MGSLKEMGELKTWYLRKKIMGGGGCVEFFFRFFSQFVYINRNHST